MQSGTFNNTVSPYGYPIGDISMQDLLSNCTGSVGRTVDSDRLKYEHPGVEFIGLIGFDAKQNNFVLLQMDNQEGRNCKDTELSAREHEVLQLVADGYSNAEIARILVIAENTVKVHLRHIFEKLQVQSRVQATTHAIRQGWLSVG